MLQILHATITETVCLPRFALTQRLCSRGEMYKGVEIMFEVMHWDGFLTKLFKSPITVNGILTYVVPLMCFLSSRRSGYIPWVCPCVWSKSSLCFLLFLPELHSTLQFPAPSTWKIQTTAELMPLTRVKYPVPRLVFAFSFPAVQGK